MPAEDLPEFNWNIVCQVTGIATFPVRVETGHSICAALECQPGDLLEYRSS
jgi:DNA-binding Xre family transcriptional regulator